MIDRHLVRVEIPAYIWERVKAAAVEADCSSALIIDAAMDAFDALPDAQRRSTQSISELMP